MDYPANEANSYYAPSRAAWRAWLAENHATALSVWLIIYRKESGTPTLTYDDAAEEALCFGWIDSKPNKRDAQSYYLFIAKRKPKSSWSKVNKDRVARLLAAGQIAPAGQTTIDIAKANGAWAALDAIEEGIVPDDLVAALAKNPSAKGYFEAFPKSVKRGILEWIGNAKRPETRAARIAETVRLAAENIRAQQYRQPAIGGQETRA
jgi:uncharacterized protein YdeI (YjbR/CyaY-like superfamily)